jgi:RES domain-containing protein
VERDSVRSWRITRSKYADRTEAFSGKGAAQNPGRWNKAGVPVVYTCSSIALCALETLVHTRSRKALDGRFVLFEVEIPLGLITKPELTADLNPRLETREIGDQWIKKASSAVLRVPSIITGEPNYVLNPKHADFSKVKIEGPQTFNFDSRLLA